VRCLRQNSQGKGASEMSLGAWGDGDDGMDGYVTEERAEEAFVAGARACREMNARFVEQGGDATMAESIRANWHPAWGKDPGRPASVQSEAFVDVEDYKP
jgi:hypothetical protein